LFEWDEAKSRRNLRERGFDFEYARHIFDGDVLEREDRRHDYGEPRTVAIGQTGEELYVVVYTRRGARRRIISARPAKKRERDEYREKHPK
jgi:uncharacterized DUF497 family protein